MRIAKGLYALTVSSSREIISDVLPSTPLPRPTLVVTFGTRHFPIGVRVMVSQGGSRTTRLFSACGSGQLTRAVIELLEEKRCTRQQNGDLDTPGMVRIVGVEQVPEVQSPKGSSYGHGGLSPMCPVIVPPSGRRTVGKTRPDNQERYIGRRGHESSCRSCLHSLASGR